MNLANGTCRCTKQSMAMCLFRCHYLQLCCGMQRGDKILPADLMQGIKAPPSDGSFVPVQGGAISASLPTSRPVAQQMRPPGQASHYHQLVCVHCTVSASQVSPTDRHQTCNLVSTASGMQLHLTVAVPSVPSVVNEHE